jgi:hypothetical protein
MIPSNRKARIAPGGYTRPHVPDAWIDTSKRDSRDGAARADHADSWSDYIDWSMLR